MQREPPALELPACAAVFVAWLRLHSLWAKRAELASPLEQERAGGGQDDTYACSAQGPGEPPFLCTGSD